MPERSALDQAGHSSGCVSLPGDLDGRSVDGLWLSWWARGNFLHQRGPGEQEDHADGDNDDSGAIHEK